MSISRALVLCALCVLGLLGLSAAAPKPAPAPAPEPAPKPDLLLAGGLPITTYSAFTPVVYPQYTPQYIPYSYSTFGGYAYNYPYLLYR